jgi:hypothetical protein
MGKQTFERTKNILIILLLVFFLISITDASASAVQIKGTRSYQLGYLKGAQDGYKVGYDAGYGDCLKSGQKGILNRIPDPSIKDNWTKNYKRGYEDGFKKGYIVGYNNSRFKCLKE